MKPYLAIIYQPMNDAFSDIVEKYLQLALRFDKYQQGVVDAAYGKAAQLRERIAQEPPFALKQLYEHAQAILSTLEHVSSSRAKYLYAQTLALQTMVEKKLGRVFPFREEARLCLGIHHIGWQDESELSPHIETLERLLDGSGTLSERFVRWRKRFELSGQAIERFISVALHEAKARAHQLFPLPENHVEVRLVRNKPWAGYHWYQGNFRSIYELNIDIPTTIWNILHTTTHEAFCGHHTEAIVKEAELVNKCGYDEFSISLLGTPASLLAEGLAEVAEYLVIGETMDSVSWLNAHHHLHHCLLSECDAQILCTLTQLGHKPLINAALLMHEHHASDDTVFAYLRRFSPSEDELLHRMIARLRDNDYRTYMLTYPIGKSLVMQSLETAHNPAEKAEKFYEMLKAVNYPLN
jgi:hypothetical protein